MDRSDSELTAYCGLYCGDCIRYRSKASDLARDLIKELEDTDFGKYAEVKSASADKEEELMYYRKFCEFLSVLVKLKCQEPCRVKGGCSTFFCKIVACCQNKGFEGCWECDEFEICIESESLNPFHGDGRVQNLKNIRQFGLDKWANHRQKFYIWQ